MPSAREIRLLIQIPGGRVDAATSRSFGQSLREAIETNSTKRGFEMVVDLSGISYMSSSGMRELIRAQQMAKSRGGKIILDMVPERLSEKLRITGFDEMLPQKTP